MEIRSSTQRPATSLFEILGVNAGETPGSVELVPFNPAFTYSASHPPWQHPSIPEVLLLLWQRATPRRLHDDDFLSRMPALEPAELFLESSTPAKKLTMTPPDTPTTQLDHSAAVVGG